MTWLKLTVMLVLAVAVGFGGCKKEDKKPAGAMESSTEMMSKTADKAHEEMAASAQKALDEMRNKVENLKAQGSAKADLDQKMTAAEDKLSALQGASKDDWSKAKAEFDQAMSDLSKAYTKAKMPASP